MSEMSGDEVLAMLCREHDREMGGDKVFPGQDWCDPAGTVWRVGMIATCDGERTAFLANRAGFGLRLPASLLASQYRMISPPPAQGRDDRDAVGPSGGTP